MPTDLDSPPTHPAAGEDADAPTLPAPLWPAAAGTLARQTLTFVLAGGRGSRLGPLTEDISKPALPFAAQLALIDFALSNCMHAGLRRVAVLTQYRAQSLIRHLERGWRMLDINLGEFIEVVPAQQQRGTAWYAGTADAVRQNLDLLAETGARQVLVLPGDHACRMDHARLLADHAASGAPATVACLEVPLHEAQSLGVLQVGADERVTAFFEKPARPQPLPGRPGHALASMGIYVFDADFLAALLRGEVLPGAGGDDHDFGHDLLPRLAAAGVLHAHRFERSAVGAVPYWRDVGTVDAYFQAHMDLLGPAPALDLHDDAWPILSLQRQLPPTRFVADAQGRPGRAEDSLVASGCVVQGASVRRSVLFSKARVGPGSEVEASLLLPAAQLGRGVRLRRAIVGKHARLPDGLEAGFDAAADARRFHLSPGGVVLITAAMLAAG